MLGTEFVSKKKKKQNRKSKDMSKTTLELLELIDTIQHTLDSTYREVDVKTREVLKNSKLTKMQRINFEWGLTHLHISLVEYERDLERHKKILKEELNAASQ